MLDGWYCRTLANEQQAAQQNDNNDQNTGLNEDTESDSQDIDESRQGGGDANRAVDFKEQYRYLKKKFKFLIYENEFFQDALRSNQRRLLKVSRDRAFLLDRLLQYDKPENTSSESEETEESSEDETSKEIKKRKLEQSANGSTTGSTRGRKRKNPAATTAEPVEHTTSNSTFNNFDVISPKTQEEVERQLSKRSVMDLIPERAPATVPVEMFSNEPSLDSEPTDHLVEGSSPTHVAAEECVPMEYSN